MPRQTLEGWVRKLHTLNVLLTKNTEDDIYNHMIKLHQQAEELFEKYDAKYDSIIKELEDEENHMYAKYNWRQGDPSRFWKKNADNWYSVDCSDEQREEVEREYFLITYDIWADFMICDKYANHWNEEKPEWKDMLRDIEKIRNLMMAHSELIKVYEQTDYVKYKSRWQIKDREWIQENELLQWHKDHPRIEVPSTTDLDILPDEYPTQPLRDDCKYCKKHWEDMKPKHELAVKIWNANAKEHREWQMQKEWEQKQLKEERELRAKAYQEHIAKKDSIKLHCEHCDYQAHNEFELEDHNKTEEHKKKSRFCNICNLQCRNDADYKYHLETTKHKKNAGLIEKVKIYKCSHCDYQTTIKCNYQKHIVAKNHIDE